MHHLQSRSSLRDSSVSKDLGRLAINARIVLGSGRIVKKNHRDRSGSVAPKSYDRARRVAQLKECSGATWAAHQVSEIQSAGFRAAESHVGILRCHKSRVHKRTNDDVPPPELEENYSDGCVEEEEEEDQDLPPRRRRPPRRLMRSANVMHKLRSEEKTPQPTPVKMAEKDLYIAALEKKLAELSGIEVDQIKKNQLANASSEARSIREMAEYVEGIQVKQAGLVITGQVNPQVAAMFAHIKAELVLWHLVFLDIGTSYTYGWRRQ
ncbi:hypothetical protein O3P69_014766 [Scylla paramamosain]|uniref:Uncharacterized protein n=1 Tax=Scylla paramamosain TaxID=85552 RepID=A0AAW0U2F7_SCYPA